MYKGPMFKWFEKFSPAFKRTARERKSFERFLAIPMEDINEVRFFKQDEITRDLICCEIEVGDKIWFFHEEAVIWETLLDHLSRLDDFDQAWFSKVSQPSFETSLHIAFHKNTP